MCTRVEVAKGGEGVRGGGWGAGAGADGVEGAVTLAVVRHLVLQLITFELTLFFPQLPGGGHKTSCTSCTLSQEGIAHDYSLASGRK